MIRRLPDPITPGIQPENPPATVDPTVPVGPVEWDGEKLIQSTNPAFTSVKIGDYTLPTSSGPVGFVLTSNGLTTSWSSGGGCGSGYLAVTEITSDLTITTEQFIVYRGMSNANFVLPLNVPGKIVFIENASSYNITVYGTIDTSADPVILYPKDTIYLVSNAQNNWVSL